LVEGDSLPTLAVVFSLLHSVGVHLASVVRPDWWDFDTLRQAVRLGGSTVA
jgi:hypothetical protein